MSDIYQKMFNEYYNFLTNKEEFIEKIKYSKPSIDISSVHHSSPENVNGEKIPPDTLKIYDPKHRVHNWITRARYAYDECNCTAVRFIEKPNDNHSTEERITQLLLGKYSDEHEVYVCNQVLYIYLDKEQYTKFIIEALKWAHPSDYPRYFQINEDNWMDITVQLNSIHQTPSALSSHSYQYRPIIMLKRLLLFYINAIDVRPYMLDTYINKALDETPLGDFVSKHVVATHNNKCRVHYSALKGGGACEQGEIKSLLDPEYTPDVDEKDVIEELAFAPNTKIYKDLNDPEFYILEVDGPVGMFCYPAGYRAIFLLSRDLLVKMNLLSTSSKVLKKEVILHYEDFNDIMKSCWGNPVCLHTEQLYEGEDVDEDEPRYRTIDINNWQVQYKSYDYEYSDRDDYVNIVMPPWAKITLKSKRKEYSSLEEYCKENFTKIKIPTFSHKLFKKWVVDSCADENRYVPGWDDYDRVVRKVYDKLRVAFLHRLIKLLPSSVGVVYRLPSQWRGDHPKSAILSDGWGSVNTGVSLFKESSHYVELSEDVEEIIYINREYMDNMYNTYKNKINL